MRSIVIGTAGHIDHGKTALIKALTGTDTDRLKEEKARGITIELGFAELDLGDDLQAGVVDVPGHERFVRNMVAGTTGIDLVLMVVAADEGVMPQTREHLDICNLLGVRHGVVALTKTDLVDDPAWLEMVVEDLRAELAGTFLEDAPIVRVSAQTAEGLDTLVDTLRAAAGGLVQRSPDAHAFLGIDRTFSMRGFGTVVTGTLVSGTLCLEDNVDILPDPSGKLRGLKIRGLQNHGRDLERIEAGMRTAVNLAGVDRTALHRGQALVHAGSLEPFRHFECTLQLVKGARPVKSRVRRMFHVGTARTHASVELIDRDALEPGGQAYASIRCAEPVAALPGHHYLLRGFVSIAGRGPTIGGGRIVGVAPAARHRRDRTAWRNDVALLDVGELAQRLVVLLRRAGPQGAGVEELKVHTGEGNKALGRELDALMAARKVLKFDRERARFIASTVLDELAGSAAGILEGFHRHKPLLPGMPAEQLRSTLARRMDPRLFRLLIDTLSREGKLVQQGDVVRLGSHRVQLDASGTALEKRIRGIYQEAGLTPPRPEEAAGEVRRDVRDVVEILHHLARTGFLTRVSGDMYVPTTALDELRRRVVEHLEERGELSTQDFKALAGGTRKHVIPLAEFFDREKTTLRVGQKRVLRRKEQE